MTRLVPDSPVGPFEWTSDWTQALRETLGQLDIREMRCRRILEIGVYEGRGTRLLLHEFSPGRYVGIDKWDLDDVCQQGPATRLRAVRNVRRAVACLSAPIHAELLWAESAAGLQRLQSRCPAEQFDLIYVDGGHSTEAVLRDSQLAWPLLSPGGLMLWDDYLWVPDSETAADRQIYPVRVGIEAFLAEIGRPNAKNWIRHGRQFAVVK